MKANKLKRDLFIILVSSFVVILCWIGFNIYSAAVSSTIDETLAKQILPIVPSFDLATIANIKRRKRVTPVYEPDETASEEAELTPTPSPLPLTIPLPIEVLESSPAATIQIENSASSGGTITP